MNRSGEIDELTEHDELTCLAKCTVLIDEITAAKLLPIVRTVHSCIDSLDIEVDAGGVVVHTRLADISETTDILRRLQVLQDVFVFVD